jgi:hypothetical protein
MKFPGLDIYPKYNRYLLVTFMLLLVGCTAPEIIRSTAIPGKLTQPIASPTTTNIATPTRTRIETATVASSTIPQSDSPLVILPLAEGKHELYGLLELTLQTSIQVSNPYDPDEIDLRLEFIAPSGKVVEVGAFWYQDYDMQTRTLKGKPIWNARFTPTEIGQWSAVARIPEKGWESTAANFQVVESDNPGFIRLHPTNPRYLAFDNGDFFFPIGLNMGWWGGGADAIEEYGRWLDLFTNTGGNTIRVWMAAWSFGIEWKDTGLGNYNNRMYEDWLLDQLFKLAEAHHVKIILVLMNHGPLSLYTNTEWKDNPYNAALGGPLDTPDQFVTDPIAKAYYQRRLNYIVNRWGYSTSLLAWEWFNEVNLTTITDETLIPWLQEMTVDLRERDVNHHRTSISYAGQGSPSIWNMPEIDIIQKHEYALQERAMDKDLADRVVADFTELAVSAPGKPILMGEFGYSAANYGDDIEITGIHLHNGLWATTFAGYAGSGMYWWWDTYVEKYSLWSHYKGLSNFLAGVDLTRYTPFSAVEIDGPGDSGSQAIGLGMHGVDSLVWLRSNCYTVQASVAALARTVGSQAYAPHLIEGLTLTLKEIPKGVYTVRWFHPQTAKWLEVQSVSTQDHRLNIPIPPFRADLAAKIIRNP